MGDADLDAQNGHERKIDQLGPEVNLTVTPEDLINAYGLGGVTYFPHQGAAVVEPRTADFLSTIGLPA